jgi:hypothetical protein
MMMPPKVMDVADPRPAAIATFTEEDNEDVPQEPEESTILMRLEGVVSIVPPTVKEVSEPLRATNSWEAVGPPIVKTPTPVL